MVLVTFRLLVADACRRANRVRGIIYSVSCFLNRVRGIIYSVSCFLNRVYSYLNQSAVMCGVAPANTYNFTRYDK